MLILVHCLENKLEYRAVGLTVNALIINEHFITDARRTAHIVEQCGSQMILFVVWLVKLLLGADFTITDRRYIGYETETGYSGWKLKIPN